MSLVPKLLRGASINVFEHGLKVAFMFVTTPLMVKYLGMEDYGTWLLALAVIAYLRMLDLGVSLTGSRFLGKAIGAGNESEYDSLVRNFTKIYTWVGLATIVATVVAVVTVPEFVDDREKSGITQWLIGGFGVVTAIRFFTRIYEVVLKGHVRYDAIGASSIIKTILQSGLVIVMLISGYGVLALLAVHIVTDLIDQVLLILFAKKLGPKRPAGSEGNYQSRTGELLRYSASAMTTRAGNSLRNGIDPLIIMHVSGVSLIPVYNVGARFLTILTDVINSIFGGNLIAAFSQLEGRGDRGSLKEKILKSIRSSAAISAIAGFGLVVFSGPFIEAWLGDTFEDSKWIVMLLVPGKVMALAQFPIVGVFYSQNRQHILAILTICAGAFNVILSLVIASHIGFMGVVWGTCIESLLTYCIVFPWLVKRHQGIPLSEYFGVIMATLAKVGIGAAGFWVVFSGWIEADYLRLGLMGSLYCALIALLSWLWIMTRAERAGIVSVLRSRFARR